MSVENITPETLTFEHIKQWDPATMRRYMQVPEMRDAIYKTVQTQSLEAVEAAQAQIETTPVAETVVGELTARVRVGEAAESVVVVVPEPPKKLVVEYQVKDEDGTPLGRPTHLEAGTQEELIEKMKEAHTQATRAFHRLKKQKVQSLRDVNNQPAAPAEASMSDADLLTAVKDLKSDDPKVALEAHRKLNAAETAKIQAEANAKIEASNELRRQEQVSYTFLKSHQNDFNNCEANVSLIKSYFEDNQLAWTVDNLEIAFHALENELAPVATPVVTAPPVNPAPVAASLATPVVTAPAQSVAATPVTPVVPANPVPPQPRPGVNGGIVPGQNSAPRPAATAKGLTMEEVNSWDAQTMRAKMRIPHLRTEIERVVAEAKIRRGR